MHYLTRDESIGCCSWEAGRYELALPWDFKRNRAATVHAKLNSGTVAVQRNSNTTAPALQRPAFVTAAVLS